MPVVVVCTVCKQRSRVMEDMVGKPVRCPACGKDFVARPETALGPSAAPAPVIKKTGVKSSELKPHRKSDSWAEIEEASPSRQSSARHGGLFFLWLGLAFLVGAAAGGTGVYIAVHNEASQDPFAGAPDGFKLPKDFDPLKNPESTKKESEDLRDKKEPADQKKGETDKKSENKSDDKKSDIKIVDKKGEDLKTGPVETAGGASFNVKTSHIMAAGFGKDGKELLVCGRDGDLTWYDADSLKVSRSLPMPAHKKGLDGIDIDREGKTLLAVSFGTLIELVDSGSGERNPVESKIRGNFRGSAISDDGKTGVTLLDTMIHVWDLNERKLLKMFNPHKGLSLGVALSPNGKLLASSGQVDDSVTLIDTTTFKEIGMMERNGGKKLRGANVSATFPAFSPDSKYLAFPIDSTLVIFHVPSKKERMVLKIESKSTMLGSASFSSDGNTVALGVGDGTVHLWDVRTGERRAILSMNSKKRSNMVASVRFSPDDKKVLAANRLEHRVFLWDLDKVNLEPVDLAKTIKDPTVDIATNPKDPKTKKDPRVTRKLPMGTKEILKIAGPIDAHLGIVMDADAGSLLATLPTGYLKQYSYPDFKAQGIYKLAGTGQRPVLDQKRGLLYTLVANPKGKPAPPAKKRGGNEIHVYDVKNVLDGKIASGNTLRPSKVFTLNIFASQLLLTSDGASLYVLDNADPKNIKLVRLDAEKGERSGELALAENTDCLCLTRDGKKILAGSHVGTRSTTKPKPHQGSIQVIDQETMKLDKALAVPIDLFYLEAGDDGLVFASGGSGLKTEIVVADINQPEPVTIWKGAAPGSWIRLSDDRKRLFVSNWRSKPALVSGLILPDKIAGSELPSGNTIQVPLVGARGELMITPDGQFMICEAGVVFQLKE